LSIYEAGFQKLCKGKAEWRNIEMKQNGELSDRVAVGGKLECLNTEGINLPANRRMYKYKSVAVLFLQLRSFFIAPGKTNIYGTIFVYLS
jgi:hypothetical protein